MTCVGIILAGGRGSRMGGQDKGWVACRGAALIDNACRLLVPQVDALVISANRNLQAYAALGFPVVEDQEPTFPGPLAGVQAAVQRFEAREYCVLPVDVPYIPGDLVVRLRGALSGAHGVAVAHDGRYLQPLIFLLRGDVRASLQVLPANLAAHAWLQQVAAVQVTIPELAAVPNLNTLDSVRAWESVSKR